VIADAAFKIRRVAKWSKEIIDDRWLNFQRNPSKPSKAGRRSKFVFCRTNKFMCFGAALPGRSQMPASMAVPERSWPVYGFLRPAF
jgi:hypothetical protein